jgi:hypothetical protein
MAVVVVVVQPLVAVTVKLYVPGKFTIGLAVAAPAVIPGPVQEYVPPPVALKLAVKVVHVKVEELFVAVITGVVVFCVIAVVVVVVQPLGAVTVKL